MTEEKQRYEGKEKDVVQLVSENVSKMIYDHGKVKILTLIEAVMPQSDQRHATKRAIEHILSDVASHTGNYVRETLAEIRATSK